MFDKNVEETKKLFFDVSLVLVNRDITERESEWILYFNPYRLCSKYNEKLMREREEVMNIAGVSCLDDEILSANLNHKYVQLLSCLNDILI